MVPSRTGRLRAAVVGLTVALLPAAMGASSLGYRVTFLGELQQSGATTAHSLNRNGQVVGESGAVDGAGETGFVWKAGWAMRALSGLPGGHYSQAFAVNSEGVIAGSSNTSATVRAVVWTRDGKAQEIGTLPGDSASQALGINDRDEVVG
jgi:uncharacterized membrane protein